MTLTRKRDSFFPSAWNDLFENNFLNAPTPTQRGITVPAVNIKEDENGYTIEMASPGMKKEDFKIDLDNDLLSITSEKMDKTEDKEDNYTRQEYSFSKFSRSFRIPEAANREEINAEYVDGILSVHITKKEEAKVKPKRTIEIG